MRLFVTGSTGFIGSHFLRAALAAGHEVIALRYPGTQPVIQIPESDRLTWVDGDLNSFLTNPSDFQSDRLSDPSSAIIPPPLAEGPFAFSSSPVADISAFSFPLCSASASVAFPATPSTSPGNDKVLPHGCSAFSSSALVHLAAYGVSPQPCTWQNAFQINVLDSILLMERAIEARVPRIVLSGSCMEYGRSAERFENIPPHAPLEPTGPYAASKAALSVAASALCRQKNVDLAILRLFTVFGEGQNPNNLWPSLHRAALAGEDFPMSPGEQISDFVPVEEVAKAFLRALELPSEAFHFSPSPPPVSTFPSSPISSFNFPLSTFPLVANIGTGHPQTIRAFAEHWWKEWGATGKLLPGALPYRDNEAMRYVPEVDEKFK